MVILYLVASVLVLRAISASVIKINESQVGELIPARSSDVLQTAASTRAYLQSDGNNEGDDGDEKGYYKATSDKGNNGYKHLDSYHTKNGDKYGYETHSAFGKSNGDEKDDGEESEKYSEVDGDGENDDHSGLSGENADEGNEHGYEVAEHGENQHDGELR